MWTSPRPPTQSGPRADEYPWRPSYRHRLLQRSLPGSSQAAPATISLRCLTIFPSCITLMLMIFGAHSYNITNVFVANFCCCNNNNDNGYSCALRSRPCLRRRL